MAEVDAQTLDEIRAALVRGDFNHAFAIYRERSSVSEEQAELFFFELQHSSALYPDRTPGDFAALSEDELREIRRALAWGDFGKAVAITAWGARVRERDTRPFFRDLARQALGGALPDPELIERAAQIVCRWIKPGSTPQELIELLDRYPDAERLTAFVWAKSLADDAYDYCNLIHDGKLSHDQVLARLHEEHPGFSAKAYELAITTGMILTK